MPTAGGLEQSYQLVKPHMEALDRLLDETLSADVACVDDMLRYAAGHSGKRLRPALVFLVGDACGRVDPRHIQLAAVVEMIHVATLVHDDVLDKATVRRNDASLNVRWNDRDAILLGDIIFARAIRLLVSIGDTLALERLTEAVSTICEGEIHQNHLSGDPTVDTETYTRIIQRKTASLYAAGCELAAHLGNADQAKVTACAEFGMSLGTAFQIIDDVLDFSVDEREVGKSLGTDVLNGKMTLPIIHLLATLSGPEREEVEAIIRGTARTQDSVARVRHLLEEHGSLAFSLRRARGYVDESLTKLRGQLPPDAFAVMKEIAGFVLSRTL